MERQTIGYDLLQSGDVESAIRVLAAAFSTAEPPAVAMGLSLAELADFLRLLTPRAVAEQLGGAYGQSLAESTRVAE